MSTLPTFLRQFFKLESASGIILFLTATLAIAWANSPLAFFYHQLTAQSLFWINDGLMAIFFLVVGLELKRGFLEGPLASLSQAMLPLVAALGGMVFPALIYLYVNHADPIAIKGWATPVATDIAFALGVLSLFGKRIPTSLRLFLLALAIFDDMGAILIIVFGYSHGLSLRWLVIAAVILLMLCGLNRGQVRALKWYLLLGIGLWVVLWYSGVHPAIAGVLLAFAIPDDVYPAQSALRKLEHRLHPWSAFVIMPLFALANAGVSLEGLSLDILHHTVILGIVLGLFVGKQVGVFGLVWLCIKTGWVRLPDQSSWLALYGVAALCGIGFTMSLFLGTLSFQQNDVIYLAYVRIGVIIGSVMSGVVGAFVLKFASRRK